MFDRFDDHAKQVMRQTSEESRALNHEYIGTEHILLALLNVDKGLAAHLLRDMDIDLAKIRIEVKKLIKTGSSMVGSPKGQLPFTPRAKKVLELSIEAASNLDQTSIGTEHLLLGLIKEKEGNAAQALLNVGLSYDGVYDEVVNFYRRAPDDVKEGAAEQVTDLRQGVLNGPRTLKLFVDPGAAPPEEIGEFLSEVSKLYRMLGGSGITFVHTGTTCPELA
jgi:ATP-dependent Clp protease ATP-binding subunit ClpC